MNSAVQTSTSATRPLTITRDLTPPKKQKLTKEEFHNKAQLLADEVPWVEVPADKLDTVRKAVARAPATFTIVPHRQPDAPGQVRPTRFFTPTGNGSFLIACIQNGACVRAFTATPKELPVSFTKGLELARRDDGILGENDAAGLKELADKIGRPDLKNVVDRMTEKTALPARRDRLQGSGYAASVVSFAPGSGAGFNADRQNVVLGRPEGAGKNAGSLHVLSLGHRGEIVLKLGRPVTRGLVVFENAFKSGSSSSADPGKVEVSADGQNWFTLKGEAGHSPVFMTSANRMNPRAKASGGDRFSFADAGIPAGTLIQFVRITDIGGSAPSGATTTAGFDLDAVFGF